MSEEAINFQPDRDDATGLPDRRYGIAEVSDIVGVPAHVLRQWELRVGDFNPERDRSNRRIYRLADIEIARRIKQLLRDDKMTLKGAALRLNEELRGEGRPQTHTEALDLIDKIEEEARAMLDILHTYDEDDGKAAE